MGKSSEAGSRLVVARSYRKRGEAGDYQERKECFFNLKKIFFLIFDNLYIVN